MAQTQTQRIFFPGLNSLRFYAALSVIHFHLTQATYIQGLSRFPPLASVLDVIFPRGDSAVTMFFVISGFLITYLLLAEEQKNGRVDVRSFYIRRILRIWPLYYLAVILAFFVFPFVFGPGQNHLFGYGFVFDVSDRGYWIKLGFFLLLLPNTPFNINFATTPGFHLWSIGVEEQFYLLWPLLVRKFVRRIGWLSFTIILLKLLSLVAVGLLLRNPEYSRTVWANSLFRFLRDWQLEAMACGAFAANLLFHNREQVLKVIFHPVVKYGSALLVIANIVTFDTDVPPFRFLLAVLYTVVLMNIAANPKPVFRFENRLTAFLGNISFGVYIYHLFVMYALLHLFNRIGFMPTRNNALVYVTMLYIQVYGLTILIAALSYRFFETPFLRLKARFAIVRSTSTGTTPFAVEPQADTPVQPV